MKKTFVAVMIAITALSSGCGKANSKAPISNAGARLQRDGTGGTGRGVDGSLLQGQVFQFTDMSNGEFQTKVKGYLSSSIPQEFVGYVNGRYDTNTQETGFYIGGRVRLSSGRFNTSGVTRTSFASNGQVAVAIYDEYTGKTDEKGEVIPPASISYQNISGEINGRAITLAADDDYNRVTLQGELVGSYFEGRIYYRNYRQYDGSTPTTGDFGIGWFRVPACSMFVCN